MVANANDNLAIFPSPHLQLIIKSTRFNRAKRVTELINRTNQFNLEGARVTLADMNNWFNNNDYIILSGRTSDCFGDMGVTCVTVGKLTGEEFRIITFVLSCRVFGYHFEHSVMNFLKALALTADAKKSKAKYVATAVNAPCKDFLKDNGFVDDGEFSYFD
jgi:FkbH-like protein